MSIRVKCDECGEEFSLKDSAAGKGFPCKVCGASVQVPGWNDDELGELPDTGSKPRRARSGDASTAASRTFLPAVFLYIVAGLSVANHVGGMVMAGMGFNLNPFVNPMENPNLDPQVRENQRMANQIGGFIGSAIGLLADFLVILGAISLQRLRNFPLAMTGMIVSLIPCLSPCLVMGMPFGLWGLVVLFSNEVREEFQ